MRLAGRFLRWLVLLLVLALCVGVAWLYLRPPLLLRVGTGYAAKIVCSNVFIAGRDADQVLETDVQAPGNPLLRLLSVSVDRDDKTVTSQFLGVFASSVALYRNGLGCTNVPDGDVDRVRAEADLPVTNPVFRPSQWPEGDQVGARDPRLSAVLTNQSLLGPGMRAVVVVKDGQIVGEAYGAGFDPKTPLLGWSMTKTVNAALVGRVLGEGTLSLTDRGFFPSWMGHKRQGITLQSLLAMDSGLEFNEDYGDVTDVTRMLFLSDDMAGFAASKPLVHEPGTTFSYSTGTGMLLSRIWMDRLSDPARALSYPQEALFRPLGMTSAVLEMDARGTYAGSSYLYATARDWARFGLFLAQDGVWRGERLLSSDFMELMRTGTKPSGGRYTGGQAWKVGPGGTVAEAENAAPGTIWALGHDGQSLAVLPSEGLVILRMGLTPSNLHYKPQRLVEAVEAAFK